MGLFDFFKKDRGYDIHSLEFCEVGKDGKRETQPGLQLHDNARYVMPVVRMTSRIDRTVKMTVRITNPEGKVYTYSMDAPLKPCENRQACLAWWGSESRTAFSKTGIWRFEVLDEDNGVIIEAPLEITSLDSLWEEDGWIHIDSRFEFCNTHNDYSIIDDWGTRQFMEPEYIRMRCKYTSLSKVEREVTYDVRIKNLATGKVKEFSHTVTLNPRGGWLQMCGWGNSKGTSYEVGKHVYSLYYRGKQLDFGNFDVVKSPRQRGWIEPLSLDFFFGNTEEEYQSWLYDKAVRILYLGKPLEQQPFKGSYKYLVVRFLYRSLDSGHPIKFKYEFYLDGVLSYTCADDESSKTGPSGSCTLQYSSTVVSGEEGKPLLSGRYQVKLYLKTEELAEHFIMQHTFVLT